jgi:hypothetical protein
VTTYDDTNKFCGENHSLQQSFCSSVNEPSILEAELVTGAVQLLVDKCGDLFEGIEVSRKVEDKGVERAEGFSAQRRIQDCDVETARLKEDEGTEREGKQVECL